MAPRNDNLIVRDLRQLDQVLVGQNGQQHLLDIALDPHLQIPVAHTKDGQRILGTMAIGQHTLANITSKALNDAEKAAVLQWTEYRMNRIDRIDGNNINRKQMLEELNDHLEQRSYLIGNKCTAADFIIAIGLHSILIRMNLLEREAYPHLGRWFEQVQRNCVVVGGNGRGENKQLPWNPKVVFSKTPL